MSSTMASSRISKKARNKKARNKRRHTGNNEHHSSIVSIRSLPRDLLVEVIASVASHSFIDLHNLKKCSKDFLDATEDNYVWQRVSLETFPLIQWHPNNKKLSFLERCRRSENIESLYREGLREYFNKGKIDGLESLKAAAQKGHKEAKYVCGMISLCSQDNESRKQGLEHMRFLRNSKSVVSSRKKVRFFLGSLWKKATVARNQGPLCDSKNTCQGWIVKNDKWTVLEEEDDDIGSCEYCRWDHELKFFYKMLNV